MIEYKEFIENNILSESDYCIATFIDRINIYLDLWLKHYVDLDLDIYIFVDIRFKEKAIEFFKNKNKKRITLISIPYEEKSTTLKYAAVLYCQQQMQDKFLQYYKKMIIVDLDELLVSENFIDILKNDRKDYIVTNGFEIVHNYRIEKDYDNSKSLLEQRKYGTFLAKGEKKSCYNKISIVSKKHVWKSSGKHACCEGDNLVYLLHLGRFDIKTMFENYQKSKLLYKTIPKHHTFETEECVKKYIDEFFTDSIIEIPSNIKKNIKI
jgi:hypothetical protein